jgi:hypothetical protein
MAPIIRSTDSPPVTPADSHDPNSQESSLGHASDTLPLVLEQMALINARLDAQTADAAAAFTTIIADAVTMRTTTPRVTSSPRTSHHLHRTPLPDMPIQPADRSFRRHRRIAHPPPVATRTRTARRLLRPSALPFLVDRLLPFLADFPLPLSVVLIPTKAYVAPPLTRWSSAALHMKHHALIRTHSHGP